MFHFCKIKIVTIKKKPTVNFVEESIVQKMIFVMLKLNIIEAEIHYKMEL